MGRNCMQIVREELLGRFGWGRKLGGEYKCLEEGRGELRLAGCPFFI
jgi:hypothetical protein